MNAFLPAFVPALRLLAFFRICVIVVIIHIIVTVYLLLFALYHPFPKFILFVARLTDFEYCSRPGHGARLCFIIYNIALARVRRQFLQALVDKLRRAVLIQASPRRMVNLRPLAQVRLVLPVLRLGVVVQGGAMNRVARVDLRRIEFKRHVVFLVGFRLQAHDLLARINGRSRLRISVVIIVSIAEVADYRPRAAILAHRTRRFLLQR